MIRALGAVLLLSAAAFAAPAKAPKPAAPAKPLVLPGQDAELKTEDGWTLAAKYLPAGSSGQTLVLVHGKGERKELWTRLASALEKNGYGYLGIDLRGHGASQTGPDGQPLTYKKFKSMSPGKGPNDYEDMVRDVAAGVAWLAAQGVPEETIGVLGTDVGASIALKYAAMPTHQKVPFVVMLSPGTRYEEVLTVNAIRLYKNRPILMVYSDADRFSSRDTPVLFAFARMAAGPNNVMLITVPKLPGVRLPLSKAVGEQVVAWLKSPIKSELPSTSTPTAPGEPGPGGIEDPNPELDPLPLPPEKEPSLPRPRQPQPRQPAYPSQDDKYQN